MSCGKFSKGGRLTPLPEPAMDSTVKSAVSARVRVLRTALVAALVLAWPIRAVVGEVSERYMLALNLTESLPERAFWIERVGAAGEARTPREVLDGLSYGDRIAFLVGEGAREHYRPETVFVKKVKGLPGQTVTVNEDRIVHIDGQPVAKAREQSRSGLPLQPIEGGVIPEGKVFVWTPHEDSYDSRYADIGLVDSARLIGTARFSF